MGSYPGAAPGYPGPPHPYSGQYSPYGGSQSPMPSSHATLMQQMASRHRFTPPTADGTSSGSHPDLGGVVDGSPYPVRISFVSLLSLHM